MPQLDKLSFSTQYLWLTLFVIILYWLTAEYFAVNVFKNLKLRSIIHYTWQMYAEAFNFNQYQSVMFKTINSTISNFYALRVFLLLADVRKISTVFFVIARLKNDNLSKLFKNKVNAI